MPILPPEGGFSGIVIVAPGETTGGSTHGLGVAGFQSFVQSSSLVQPPVNNENHIALQKRLKAGRVAFYGAFEVPERMKREFEIA
jgi:hypothetical protein